MTIDRLSKGCELPRQFLERIQNGTLRYTYRGIPTYKNPFDLALYQLLLWEQKPRTLIEIGSKSGGSALWFADTLRSFAIDSVVYSIDIEPPSGEFPGVAFYEGDGRQLADTLSPEFMSALPRPIIVIEDADHRAATTLAVLRFFDSWMRTGEYMIVEDGIIDDLYNAEVAGNFEGGPRRGVEEFLRDRDGDYEIDTRFCDFFGLNMTWNVNGYLRRIR